MTPASRAKIDKAYALVASITIIAIAALEGYALTQGIDGTALTAALAAIAGLGGAGIGRMFR